MEQHAETHTSGIVVATHHAAWVEHKSGPLEWVGGVVQWHAFRPNPDGKTISRKLLLDNTHFELESYIDNLCSPFLHAIHSWHTPTPEQLLALRTAALGRIDRDPYHGRIAEIALRTFDAGKWFARELGHEEAESILDPVTVAEDNEIPVQLVNGHPLHVYHSSMIPSMWIHGQVWPAVALLRDIARTNARVLHLAIGRGEGTKLGVNRLKTLYSSETHSAELDASRWHSPHYSHAEDPFGDEEPTNARFKYLIPTGRWWPELLEVARATRQRTHESLTAADGEEPSP